MTGPPPDATDHVLRRFHLDGSGMSPGPAADLLPLLLAPYRDTDRVRFDYPLFLHGDGAPRFTPLAQLLEELAPPGARLVHDNLVRIERSARAALGSDGPRLAHEVLTAACADVIAALALPEGSGVQLERGCETLLAQVPRDGLLLPHGPAAATHLLAFAVQRSTLPQRQRFRRELKALTHDLERRLSAQTGASTGVAEAMGGGDSFIDPSAFASVVGAKQSGSVAWSDARTERVRAILDRATAWLAQPPEAALTLVSATEPPAGIGDCEHIRSDAPCAAAMDAFATQAVELAQVFGAARAARLELADAYEAERHDALLAALDWRGFTREELALVPPIVAVEDGERLGDAGMLDLTRVLRSGHPVHVVVRVSPACNPGAPTPLEGFRIELGYLGVSLRQAWVQQSTAARPAHLLQGFIESLGAARAALHVLSTSDTSVMGPWLYASAALEGRAHPLFRYDPEAGATWSRRLDFGGNPQPEAAWPVDGEAQPFTFADFAMIDARLRPHFMAVPEGHDDPDLVHIDAWLALPTDQALRALPFVWGIDAAAGRHRVAITRALAFATRDRQAFWRSLQELAGIGNAYAEAAEAAALERARAEAATALEAARAKHATELDEVRTSEASEALRKLATALMDGDVTAAIARPPRAPAPAAAPQPAAEAPAEAPAEADDDDDDLSFDDLYIETVLCTTCNECLNVNPLVFVYNDNKQAIVGDPSAGTFAEFVRAAELCSARCIHPGKPMNPNEPGLDELLARVAELGV